MTRNTQRKFNPNRHRKGKSRDTSLVLPDNTNSFIGIIHSAMDHNHFNVEIMNHDDTTNTWNTTRTIATLMKGGRRAFFNKAVPRGLTERIILVERTGLSRQASSSSDIPRELNIIVHCYTIDEIRMLKDDDYLPPNIASYMESTLSGTADKAQLGNDDVIFDFGDAEEMEEDETDEDSSENEDTEEGEFVNPNSAINPAEATSAAIAAAMGGMISRKKKSGKSAPDDKKRTFKKKRGGSDGSKGWISAI
jgi:hypothetical protein